MLKRIQGKIGRNCELENHTECEGQATESYKQVPSVWFSYLTKRFCSVGF